MVSYNYLVTYEKNGEPHYKWFATEKEMDQFIDSDPSISVNEGVHIKDYEVVRGFKRRKAANQ